MQMAMPATPNPKSGLRPSLSISAIASIVNSRLTRPTSIACMKAASVPMPDPSKIIGA